MRAGVAIKEGQLVYSISCARCKGTLIFPAELDRKDAVMKAKTRHGWQGSGREIFCDGCSDMLDDKPKKSKAKPTPKSAPKSSDDEVIELGED